MSREDIAGEDDAMLFIDGCDTALVGRGERCGQPALAVYDYATLVQCFVDQGMTEDGEAEEWISYNVAGAWHGTHTPLILYRPTNGM